MKYISTIIFGLIFLNTGQAQNRQYIAIDSNYVTYAGDTTAWVNISAQKYYTLSFWAKDTINSNLRLQFRAYDASATGVVQLYALVSPDSTNALNNAGYWRGFILRSPFSDNIPGASAVRLLVTKASANSTQGTTTPTYDAWLEN